MQRAGSRHRAGRSRTLLTTCAFGGLGGNPTDLGIKVSKTLFAPRLGAIYRLNDETVFRTGYGITYNPLPFSRPLRGFYPLTISRQLLHDEPVRLRTTTLKGHSGHRRARPELRQHPAAERRTRCARPPTTCRAAASSRGTSPSSGGCRMTSRWTRRTSARTQTGGFADFDVERVDHAGLRRRLPAVTRSSRRSIPLNLWGPTDQDATTIRCRWRSTARSRTGCC